MANFVMMHGADPRDAATAGISNFYVPDPETEPEAIAEDQRQAVLEAFRQVRGKTVYGPDGRGMDRVERTADAVDLPVWVVRRRLAELGLGPPVENPQAKVFAERSRKHRAKKKIAALLSSNQPMSSHEIGRRLGMDPLYVNRIVNNSPDFLARLHGEQRQKGGTVQLWTVAKSPAPEI